ncbi:MAG: protein-glutamate O-methyltransferase CheR [Dehalococcoidia bacterium]|nr:protein-glutamate O-methyltransferase CheR [Dehalococcoidia bacterium]
MTDQEYQFLKKKVLNITGIDLEHYKSQQMRRSLSTFIENSSEKDVLAYCRTIEQDQTGLKKLCDFLTINLTEFYRDAWAFKDLQNIILPKLTENNTHLNIWSAGCSNGPEVYTIAMLVMDGTKKVTFRIMGTDIDDLSLAEAMEGGPYREDMLKNMPQQLVARYFTLQDGNYWVRKEVKDKAVFKNHNLLADPFEKGFDLIVCRNVTIYFTEEAKDTLNKHFYDSLNDNSVLFVGATEFMINAVKTDFSKLGTCFYLKSPTTQMARN